MNRYCAVIELKEEHLADYIYIHKNVWPEILIAIKEAGAENLIIYNYKHLSIIFYECEDINDFYKNYGAKDIVKKWNATVGPWFEQSPTLDGSESVAVLEKIFDFKQQLNGKLEQT